MANQSIRATARGMKQASHLLRGQFLLEGAKRSSSLPSKLTGQIAHKSDNGNSAKSLLARSTILLQDGLDIRELPLVMRKMDARDFPFQPLNYTMEEVKTLTEKDEFFKHMLQDCGNVHQVFKLLEIPEDSVTPYSAAFALHRINQLQEAGAEEIDSFIKKAILHELYETATQELNTLRNDTVITLMKCSLRSINCTQEYIDRINKEVEIRIGDNKFNISELCTLIEMLSLNIKGDTTLTANLWMHLGLRYHELDGNNIMDVFTAFRYITPETKYIVSIVDKQLIKCWWKLGNEDIATVMRTYAILNHCSGQTFGAVGKWMFMNIHQIKDNDLMDILACYTKFKFSDLNLVNALERYVRAKINSMDKTLIGMTMEYCRVVRHLSPKIFDTVARHFETEGGSYQPHQVWYTLRPFGILNYVPQHSAKFFSKIDNVLDEKFDEYSAAHMVELLASFVYVERIPVNFLKRIFTPHFIAKIQNLPNDTQKKQCVKYLMNLWTAMMLEFPRYPITYRIQDAIGWTSARLGGRHFRFHQEVGNIMDEILGGAVKQAEIPKGTPYFIDFEILTDKNNVPLKDEPESFSKRNIKKLAIVTIMPEQCCVNTKHILGEYALRRRHLKRLGYQVIEIFYEEFMWNSKKYSDKKYYVKSLLQPHIKLNAESKRNHETD